jgi:ppGpp synthetase/RelA/SpoT-type nucleotidyltranferase
VPLPTSRSQVNKLGKRLAAAAVISAEDIAMLEDLIACHQETLERSRPRLNGLAEAVGCPPLYVTGRPKTTATIIEKLRRSPTGPLSRIQDLAGFRIVGGLTFGQQDQLRDEIVRRFPADPREPDVVDRRAAPSHGYRAVHIIVCVEDVSIEIQVRTLHQHMWANLMERLADRLGRQIRYGAPPVPPAGMTQQAAEEVVRVMMEVSDSWAAGGGPELPGDLAPIIDELSDNVWKQLASQLGTAGG